MVYLSVSVVVGVRACQRIHKKCIHDMDMDMDIDSRPEDPPRAPPHNTRVPQQHTDSTPAPLNRVRKQHD